MEKGQKLCIAVLILIVVAVISGVIIKQKESKKHEEYLEKCADANREMRDIAEKYLEALNNQDYDTYISLCSDDKKEKNPDVDSMYSFLRKSMYDFSDPIDYKDFTFSMTEIDYSNIGHYYEEVGFEEALDHGIMIWLELGNSEMKYKQFWKITFVLEDEKIKIDTVWLGHNPTIIHDEEGDQ